MNETAIPCSWCGVGLIEIDFNSRYYLRTCDNDGCVLFRERQSSREKGLAEMVGVSEPEIKKKPSIGAKLRQGYDPWLAEKKRNYRTLRNLGISPKEAAQATSRKRTQELIEKGGLK